MLLRARGIEGIQLYSDAACTEALAPSEVSILDGLGLVAPPERWRPRCSESRCDAGALSFLASFATPTVVRCAVVRAPGLYGKGWRLSRASGALTQSLESFTEKEWQEVARSGQGMGVRASWDGPLEARSCCRSEG